MDSNQQWPTPLGLKKDISTSSDRPPPTMPRSRREDLIRGTSLQFPGTSGNSGHRRVSSGGTSFTEAFAQSWSTNSGEFPAGNSSFGNLSSTDSLMRQTSVATAATTNNGVSSAIHDAARITDWDKVLELCQTVPEAASYAGLDGWTALHHACNRRCPRADVVQSLIDAYPAALLQEEDKSWLPLHYACRFKAPREVVDLLLHRFPESAKIAIKTRDNKGRRPLFYAVRYDAPTGVAELLIKFDPSQVLDEDENDESPLKLVWDSWVEKLEGKRIVHSVLPGAVPEPDEISHEERAKLIRERLDKEPKLKLRWERANLFLRAAFGFPFEEANDFSRTFRIVHATAAVRCHASLFQLACALHPEQASELDEGDLRPNSKHQTALHLAASSNAAGGDHSKTVIYNLLSLYREAAEMQDGIDGSLPLHNLVANPRFQNWSNHAALLKSFYPRAVQVADNQQRLPLHRAAEAISHVEDSEKSNVIQLVRSFPPAAAQQDVHGYFPFHYLAMHASVWDIEVESVHNAHRQAIHVRAGPNRRFPIHMACANSKARESLIQRLVQFHPRSASIAEQSGKLPLHLACEVGKGWDDGTRILYEAFPNAIRVTEDNRRAWLPLHMAAANKESPADLIRHLIDLYPESARITDRNNSYALHLGCAAAKSWQGGLGILFNAYPPAVVCRDKDDLLPLHLVALQFCKKPKAITTKPNAKVTAQTEVETKAQEAAELDILFNLIRADPTTLNTA